MRLLFVTGYGHLPDVVGGMQTATDDLCHLLCERGVEIMLLCALPQDGKPAPEPAGLPYRLLRVADPIAALPLVAAAYDADAIVTLTSPILAPLLMAAMETGRRTAVYIHNLEIHQLGFPLMNHPALLYIANSPYTAARLRAMAGIEAVVVLPIVQPHRYIVAQTGNRVLFVNPVQVKGAEIACRVMAENPDIPFTIAESWSLATGWKAYLQKRVADLPNVEWLPPVTDMRPLFARTRLLLMPSLWEEAFGRTALEAQLNGIPVVASNRGALPETVGDGGVIVDAHAPVEDWSQVVASLYHSAGVWSIMSGRARQHSHKLMLSAHIALGELLTRLALHIPSEGWLDELI